MRDLKFIKQILNITQSKARIHACYDPDRWLYYISHDPILLRKFSFDSHGIPYFKYNKPIGDQYTPVITSLFALETWNGCGGLKKNSQKDLSRFQYLSDWLLEHAEEHRGHYGWFYNFNWDRNDTQLTAPWISAMSNGMAISTLVRTWLLTKREEYLQSCEKAIHVFSVPIMEGGVRSIDHHGCIWFEEYPLKPELHVLNGFIFALFGLYDLSCLGNKSAKLLFLEGIKTLEKHLIDYDLGYWSSYDLLLGEYPRCEEKNSKKESTMKNYRSLAPGHYHAIHVQQLYILYQLTNNELFREIHLRWLSYYKLFYLCRLIYNILKRKIFLGNPKSLSRGHDK